MKLQIIERLDGYTIRVTGEELSACKEGMKETFPELNGNATLMLSKRRFKDSKQLILEHRPCKVCLADDPQCQGLLKIKDKLVPGETVFCKLFGWKRPTRTVTHTLYYRLDSLEKTPDTACIDCQEESEGGLSCIKHPE